MQDFKDCLVPGPGKYTARIPTSGPKISLSKYKRFQNWKDEAGPGPIYKPTIFKPKGKVVIGLPLKKAYKGIPKRHPGPANYNLSKSFKFLKGAKHVCKIGSSQRDNGIFLKRKGILRGNKELKGINFDYYDMKHKVHNPFIRGELWNSMHILS